MNGSLMHRDGVQNLLSELKLDPSSAEQLHLQIQRQVREKIQAHQLASGQRLPTNHELSARLNVSYETVQRAMTALADQGLIVRRQRKGTFVNQAPSPRTIGIFCTQSVFNPQASPSIWLLAHHLCNILQVRRRDAQIYYVPAGAQPQNHKTYRDLVRDLQEHRLSGLIFLRLSSDEPSQLQLLETTRRHAIPAVATSIREVCPNTVYPDHLDFYRRGLQYLARLDCRRIALAGFSTDVERTRLEVILEAAEEADIPLKPCDVMELKFGSTSKALALGKKYGQTFDLDRYDGVLLADDIVAIGFAQSLNRRGVHVPENLRVATLWNRGNPLPLALPFARFEIDVEQWAARSVKILDDLIENDDSRNRRSHVYLKLEGPIEHEALRASHFMETVSC